MCKINWSTLHQSSWQNIFFYIPLSFSLSLSLSLSVCLSLFISLPLFLSPYIFLSLSSSYHPSFCTPLPLYVFFVPLHLPPQCVMKPVAFFAHPPLQQMAQQFHISEAGIKEAPHKSPPICWPPFGIDNFRLAIDACFKVLIRLVLKLHNLVCILMHFGISIRWFVCLSV